jgi:tripartite-type tricarboxylate transporter receptor subunit TctC
MNFSRRRLFALATVAIALPMLSGAAGAQAYPTRLMRLIVPFAPGGSPDILARLLGPFLAERLGQPLVIENRPGAGAIVGTEVVVNAAPDGYTLILANTSNAINATLYDKLNFNFIRDIAPVGGVARNPLVMEVHPSVPAKTVTEFIAYARDNPGKLNMASPGNGSSVHLAGELFKAMTGVNMVHVPYRGGGPALTDLLGGQVQVMFDSTSSSIEYIRSGKLRPLAVTTSTRSQALPGVPTMGEYVPGYEASSWFGIGAPRNTPAGVVEELNRAINAALADPRIKARLADMGSMALSGSPADFRKLIADETEKWAKVVKFAGAKPD